MKKKRSMAAWKPEQGIVFRPALEPMEAAVIPARPRSRYGVLVMVPHAYEAAEKENQRAKIWVR